MNDVPTILVCYTAINSEFFAGLQIQFCGATQYGYYIPGEMRVVVT